MAHPERRFMEAAIEEAVKAREAGDYAVGAAIIKGNEIIARGGQRVRIDQDPTQHAEIVAIRIAVKLLKTRHIVDCVLYTTHEPCPMCTAAAIWAKMEGVVSGAKIEDMTEFSINNRNENWAWRTIKIPANKILEASDEKPFLIEGFMRDECKKLFHS